MGRQTGVAGLRPFECEQNLEIRGRFFDPDRLRPDVRQEGHLPLPHHALLLHGLDVEFEHENRYTSVSAYEKALQAWNDAQGVGDKPMLQIHPTVRWENTIDIKATKYLTTTFNFQLYYNRAQNYDIQTQLLLSVGLTYTFKNK